MAMRAARGLWLGALVLWACDPHTPRGDAAVDDTPRADDAVAADQGSAPDGDDASAPARDSRADDDAPDAVSAPDVARMDAGGADADDDVAVMPDAPPPPSDADSGDALPPLDAPPPPDAGDALPVCGDGDTVVSSRPGDSRFPSLVWTGSEYGVAWQDDEPGDWEIMLARMQPDGTVIGTTRVTTDGATDQYPSLAWDGARYWIAWARSTGATDGASIRVVSATPSGTMATPGTAQMVTSREVSGATQPSLAVLPAGGGLAVAWEDDRDPDNSEIYYARLDTTGARVGAEVRVTNAPRASSSPLLRWNARDGEFGLLWLDDRDGSGAYPNEELYFARLAPSGARVGGAGDVRVTNDPYRSIWPSITYDGTGYAVVWANEHAGVDDAPQIWFTLLGPDGVRRAGVTDRQLSTNPATIGAWTSGVAWNGREYAVIWEDQRHPEGDLIIMRVSSAGAPLTGEVWLHDDGSFTSHPTLIWGHDEWAMAWEDDRYMHRDPWFRRVARTACLGGAGM